MRRLLFPLLLLIPLVALGCKESVDGQCAEASDCVAGERCVFDLNLDTSYCATTCGTDAECPPHQNCREGFSSLLAGAEQVKICVDLVRDCEGPELCNGLDDDCDMVVDNEGCEIIDNCLDDQACGAFNCQAPVGQNLALCAPPIFATVEDGDVCQQDTECRNGVCETGVCGGFCRPLSDCPLGSVCVRSVGAPGRPRHNKCQPFCTTFRECEAPLDCVWRDIHEGDFVSPNHDSVCALPDPTRLTLGSTCTNNEATGGDDECQHGLCLFRTCTRFCAGPGQSCTDVNPDFRCLEVELLYDGQTFERDVCVRP